MVKAVSDVVALVLSYNSLALTTECVDNLLQISDNLRIVIVDNGSDDGSTEGIIQAYGKNPRVYVLENKTNCGYARGNNAGFIFIHDNLKDAKYVLLLNPDIIVKDQDTILSLKKTLEEHEEYAVASCQIIRNNEWEPFSDYIWKYPDNTELIWAGTILGKVLVPKTRNIYHSIKVKDDIAEVDVVSGCFFMAKIDDVQRIKGFDERTFLYFEEPILAKRMSQIGKKIVVLINERAYHNHQVKEKELNNYIKRMFNKKCFHDSKMVYVEYYSNMNAASVIVCRMINKIDMRIKTLIWKLYRSK